MRPNANTNRPSPESSKINSSPPLQRPVLFTFWSSRPGHSFLLSSSVVKKSGRYVFHVFASCCKLRTSTAAVRDRCWRSPAPVRHVGALYSRRRLAAVAGTAAGWRLEGDRDRREVSGRRVEGAVAPKDRRGVFRSGRGQRAGLRDGPPAREGGGPSAGCFFARRDSGDRA